MKVRFAEQLENERITMELPGTVARKLDEYREFLKHTGQGARDRKEVCAVVIATFLETNQAFRTWKKRHASQAEKRVAQKPAVNPPVANGQAEEEVENG
jgi:hypothetical protein